MSYVITGSPGVGKHTITNELSKVLQLPIIDINNIAKEAGLYESREETNDVDVSKLEKILADKLEESCIVVGHLAPYVLKSSNFSKIIILRKNPYELIPIYEKRGYSKEKIKENSGGEALGVIAHDATTNFGKEKSFQIDVTKKSVDETIKVIQDMISGNQINQEIEWLETIVKNGDLEKFFTY